MESECDCDRRVTSLPSTSPTVILPPPSPSTSTSPHPCHRNCHRCRVRHHHRHPHGHRGRGHAHETDRHRHCPLQRYCHGHRHHVMVLVMVLVIFMVTAIVVTRVGMAVLHRGGCTYSSTNQRKKVAKDWHRTSTFPRMRAPLDPGTADVATQSEVLFEIGDR